MKRNPDSRKKFGQLTNYMAIIVFWSLNICFPAAAQQKIPENFRLKFLDEYIIPYNYQFDHTTVGGLSGIDYDAISDTYYSISDDRSQINPARFYTYHIRINGDKIDTLIFNGVHLLKNENGHSFPKATATHSTVDPEALRVWENNLIWSSEGERMITKNESVLLNPQIFLSEKDGRYIDTFRLPDQLKVTAGNSGVRQNGGFEGLDISADGKYLYVSVEEPLLQDGPRAGLNDSSGVVRIIKYDLKTKTPVAQYAYRIEPVAYPVFPPNGFRVNGISDIKYIGNDRLLVVERSFSLGRLSCTIRVYIADLSQASDVSNLQTLKGENDKVAPKKLIINMDELKMFIDNIEGVTFGPVLASGNPSLIFIADNNFNQLEKSQVLLFEVIKE